MSDQLLTLLGGLVMMLTGTAGAALAAWGLGVAEQAGWRWQAVVVSLQLAVAVTAAVVGALLVASVVFR